MKTSKHILNPKIITEYKLSSAKNPRIKAAAIMLAAAMLPIVSCTEIYDPGKEADCTGYLVVEAMITGMRSYQSITLSRSIPFAGPEVDVPVSGAEVTLFDGTDTTVCAEDPEEAGVYYPPTKFRAVTGKEYTLTILVNEDGVTKKYTSTSTLGSFNFTVSKIDYKYAPTLAENVWTIGVWGKNGKDSHYLVIPAVNGNSYPLDNAVVYDDQYFSESELVGYPITYLYQGEDKVKEYGECAKVLEKGDKISLVCCGLSDEDYEFMTAFSNNVESVSIPILSTRPANIPCNIQGENVFGYFIACPIKIVTCTVDDPYRQSYKE